MRSLDEWLASEESGEPFSNCVSCRLPLLEMVGSWLVNKDYHLEECVLEYAVCQPCRDETSSRISEDSKTSVRDFLENRIDWKTRVEEFMMMHDPAERFDACIACRTPREELKDFTISAHFDSGGYPIIGPLPLLLCKSCAGQMTAGFSEESRQVWRDFLEMNFEGPPDSGMLGMF